MIVAIPIDEKGIQCGLERSFTDMQWAKMVKTFGASLAWKKINVKTKTIELKPKEDGISTTQLVEKKKRTSSPKKAVKTVNKKRKRNEK